MRNILFDCERMKYPNTGFFTFCDELGHAIMRELQAGEKMHFYLPPKLGQFFGPDAGYIWQRSLHKIYLPHREKIDLWHTTYQSSRYNTLQRGTKKLLTIHDLNFLYEDKEKYKRERYLGGVQKSIDRSDRLVAISQYAKEDVLRHLQVGDKPFDVIYNGADVREFPGFDAPRFRPPGAFLFAIGTVLPKKNFHVLPALLKGRPDLSLVIAGNINENYAAQIVSAAEQQGVSARLHIIGPVTPEEKYWYYRHCLAFTFPSIAEGFGLPAIEAMHSGKPVFLSDKTCLPEIGGPYAYYFRDFHPDAMRAVLEDGLRDYAERQPAEAIKAHAASFSWTKAAREYVAIYRGMY